MKYLKFILLFLLILFLSSSTSLYYAYAAEIDFSEDIYDDSFNQKGSASWYGPGFHGKLTANGQRYNQFGLTAAHKSLKFNQVLHISNLANNKSVLVQVNDRGPYVGERIIDLSEAAMIRLDGMQKGVIRIHAVAVSDTKGIPLDENLAYFVECSKENTLDEAQKAIEKLHKVGNFENHIFPMEDGYSIGLGPFTDFQKAQDELIDLITIFPLVTIKLYDKNLSYIQ